MLRIPLLLILSTLAWPALAVARDEQVRTTRLRAICFEHVDQVREVFAVLPGEDPREIPVELFTTTFSDEVEVPVADGRIHFAIRDAGGGDGPGRRIIASPRAAPGKSQLALFLPSGDPEKPYRCVILDDSLRNFPLGSSLAVNLAPTPFRFAIGEHLETIAPGKIGKIPAATKTNDRGQVSVIIAIADPQKAGQWRAVNQTRWFAGDDKRDLLISFLHPRSGKPTVRCYPDSPGRGATDEP